MLLQMKRLEDAVSQRAAAEAEAEKSRAFQCLWKFKHLPFINQVSSWFEPGLPAGCPKLAQLTQDGAKELHKCMCAEYEAELKLKREAERRAALAEQARAAAEKADAAARAAEQQHRAHEKEVARETAKELLYRHMSQKPGFADLLRKLRDASPGQLASLQAQLAGAKPTAQQQQQQQGQAQQPAAAPLVSPEKVEKCVGEIESSSVRENVRKSFEGPNAANACSLLGLASNPILRDVHACLCATDGSGSGSGSA